MIYLGGKLLKPYKNIFKNQRVGQINLGINKQLNMNAKILPPLRGQSTLLDLSVHLEPQLILRVALQTRRTLITLGRSKSTQAAAPGWSDPGNDRDSTARRVRGGSTCLFQNCPKKAQGLPEWAPQVCSG